MSEAEQVARGMLERLQEAVASKDVEAALALLHDDVILFGSAAENVGKTHTRSYLTGVLAQDETLRWGWDQVLPVYYEPDVALGFAVIGSVGFEDPQGRDVGERQHFRLTCVAVLQDGDWRLRHFHGSVPASD